MRIGSIEATVARSAAVVKGPTRALLEVQGPNRPRRLAARGPRPPLELNVGLSRTSRRIGWLFVLFLHAFNAVYIVGMLCIYDFMASPTMSVFRSKLDLMKPDQYVWIPRIYVVISTVNIYCALSILLWSLYHRRLVFGHMRRRVANPRNTLGSRCSSIMDRILRGLRPLSVRGHLFDGVLLVRELVELGSQTYQAYSSSLLVSSVWINQAFASVVFVNCITQVVMGTRTRIGPGRRRFICTVVDLVLDFIWGILLPMQILVYYVPTFVRNKYSFSSSFMYADAEFTNAMLDFKQFFITSKVDALTTIHPYINTLSSLSNMKVLLQEDMDSPVGVQSAQVVPTDPELHITTSNASGKHAHCFHQVIHALVAAAGLTVWITSLYASGLLGSDRCDSDCKLQLHPWFVNECACCVQEINCFKRGIVGEADQIASVMRTLNVQALNYLILSHCPALSVPSAVRRFPNLLGLQFYNVTMVHWPREASLSRPYFTRLNFVYIVRSRLPSGIPEGLTYKTASNLQDLEFVASDLGTIPVDINVKWPHVMVLFMEHCALHRFPESLTKMASLADLSLTGNNISMLPQSTFVSSRSLIVLSLDGNPIDSIPESYGAMESWFTLTIQDTQLSSLSDTVSARVQNGTIQIFTFNTPYCLNATRGSPCRAPISRIRYGHFPLALVDSIRHI